jgi:unsaturated rhamnogalacturonyl hydrolase
VRMLIGYRRLRTLQILLLFVASGFCPACFAFTETPSEFLPAVGDAPDTAPPLASDLSPELTRSAVEKAMTRVADWQLARVKRDFNRDWTFAALYTGFMAASESTGDAKYSNAMRAVGEQFNWQLGSEYEDANDVGVGRTYVELYLKFHDLKMISGVRSEFDRAIQKESAEKKQLPWWWADALFMAPPTWAAMSKATGNAAYLDYMTREWWATSGRLYDPREHLFFRDTRFFDQRHPNGKKIFWSRGNGWVIAGLAGVLKYMPQDYPERPKFVEQFQEMASALAAIQGQDGLWRTGLLDPDIYQLPENSGSAFFTYALAWGINNNLLDRSKYVPVVSRAWKGLLSHIYEDGRLGCIQSVADAPGKFTPTSSYVYGVGAFLLAGSEVDRLAQRQH